MTKEQGVYTPCQWVCEGGSMGGIPNGKRTTELPHLLHAFIVKPFFHDEWLFLLHEPSQKC
jgi:hypothetical protein